MDIFSWLVSSRWIPLNLGSSWGREKCLVQQLGKGICPGSVLYCGKLWYWDLINCKIWNRTIFCSTVVVEESSHHLSSGLIPQRSQISSPLLPRNQCLGIGTEIVFYEPVALVNSWRRCAIYDQVITQSYYSAACT